MSKRTAFLVIIAVLLIALASALFSGTAPTPPPESFIKTDAPKALSLDISPEYLAEDTWKIVMEMIRNDFGSPETENQKDGIIQTPWQYPQTGKLMQDYRVRLTLQFSEDRYTISILPEAEFQQKALMGIYRWWISGEDNAIGNEYYTKIKKRIGRIY